MRSVRQIAHQVLGNEIQGYTGGIELAFENQAIVMISNKMTKEYPKFWILAQRRLTQAKAFFCPFKA
jgi:hypothetical protein